MNASSYDYQTESGCLSVKLHLVDKDEKEDQMGPTNLLPYPGLSELRNKSDLFRSVLTELVGTLLLVFVGCGSCVGGDKYEAGVQIDDQSKVVRISFCFGLTVATLVQTIGHKSGCHINPAVTLGLIFGRKIGLVKGALYVLAQCVGAVCGEFTLKFVVPEDMRGADTLGVTKLGDKVTVVQGVATEMVITLVLVLVVLAASDEAGAEETGRGSAPVAIGVAVTVCHLFAVPLTGASMNPARSLGPAVVTGMYQNYWVYWVGPMLGAALAAIFYQSVLRRNVQKRQNKTVQKMATKREFCPRSGIRDEESPPYEKKLVQPDSTVSCTVTPIADGKELVWIENT